MGDLNKKIQNWAVENFLKEYYSDLRFFKEFKKNINNNIGIDDDYLNRNNPYSFKSFLDGYRIIRRINSTSENVLRLFNIARKWNTTDVNGFIKEINNTKKYPNLMHHNHKEVSLASKILFLKNPDKVFPYDYKAKTSLGYKGNDYDIYKEKVEEFKKEKIKNIKKILNGIEPYTKVMEKGLGFSDEELEQIRINRFVDKMLWSGWED